MYNILILLMFAWWQSLAIADQTIEITEGMQGAIPLAIVPFHWSGEDTTVRDEVNSTIAKDLDRSGRFHILPEQDMLSLPVGKGDIKFREWRALGQDALVVGHLRLSGANYVVEFKLFDVLQKVQLAAYKTAPTRREGMRAVAHWIADTIYTKLTGTQGAFSTQIAYVTEESNKNGISQTSLVIADYDGGNPQPVVESEEPLISPALSPDNTQLAYVSFEGKKQSVYIQNLRDGRRERVANYPGINSAPAWSPDGQRLALTLSKDGNPEIYILNLTSRELTRITNHPAIDTEPTWSRDGRNLAFTSDRDGGEPQVYQVAVTGGDAQRLTPNGDYNARPVYSPDGQYIALVTKITDKFRIGLLNLKNQTIQKLTPGPLDESPSFLGNGSMIIYSAKTGGRSGVFGVSIDGQVTQSIITSTNNVRDPACSSLAK